MMRLRNFFFEDERGLFLTAIISVAFFYLWDLGNIDGLRQGTEGFYLQISKEMFETPSFITPLYLGDPHWSKPPLHFWMPMPFYAIAGGASLLMARLSIALLSLASLYFISKWVRKYFDIPKAYSFIFLGSTIGFIKYSRVFMMEIPLTLISLLASLYFFDYLMGSRRKDLLIASVTLGLAILVKGPVAFVMCIGGAGIFLLFQMWQRKKILLKDISIWASLGLILSSIWFIICYQKYGQEFFDYFFLRENMGKFTAKPYPIRVVFQGLLIYALPWSLFLPLIYFDFKERRNNLFSNQANLAYLYLLLNFSFFFLLWLIPNQRSHHYAIPSLPFFLLLILVPFIQSHQKKSTQRYLRIGYIILASLAALLSTSILLILGFESIRENNEIFIKSIISIIVILLSLFAFLQRSWPEKRRLFLSLCTIGCIWVFFIPSFYLPFTPHKIIDATKDSQVVVVVRKPYFVEEALQRKVLALDAGQVYEHIQANDHLYILHESVYLEKKLDRIAEVVERWPIWFRGRKLRDIIEAVKLNKLDLLQENMVLLKRRSLD